jgi:hypothetical protein
VLVHLLLEVVQIQERLFCLQVLMVRLLATLHQVAAAAVAALLVPKEVQELAVMGAQGYRILEIVTLVVVAVEEQAVEVPLVQEAVLVQVQETELMELLILEEEEEAVEETLLMECLLTVETVEAELLY